MYRRKQKNGSREGMGVELMDTRNADAMLHCHFYKNASKLKYILLHKKR